MESDGIDIRPFYFYDSSEFDGHFAAAEGGRLRCTGSSQHGPCRGLVGPHSDFCMEHTCPRCYDNPKEARADVCGSCDGRTDNARPPTERMSQNLAPAVVRAMKRTGHDDPSTLLALDDLSAAGVTTRQHAKEASVPVLVHSGLPLAAAHALKEDLGYPVSRREDGEAQAAPLRPLMAIVAHLDGPVAVTERLAQAGIENPRDVRRATVAELVDSGLSEATARTLRAADPAAIAVAADDVAAPAAISPPLEAKVVEVMLAAGFDGPSVAAALEDLKESPITTPADAKAATVPELIESGLPPDAAIPMQTALVNIGQVTALKPAASADSPASAVVPDKLRRATALGAVPNPHGAENFAGWFAHTLAPWFLNWMKARLEAEQEVGFHFDYRKCADVLTPYEEYISCPSIEDLHEYMRILMYEQAREQVHETFALQAVLANLREDSGDAARRQRAIEAKSRALVLRQMHHDQVHDLLERLDRDHPPHTARGIQTRHRGSAKRRILKTRLSQSQIDQAEKDRIQKLIDNDADSALELLDAPRGQLSQESYEGLIDLAEKIQDDEAELMVKLYGDHNVVKSETGEWRHAKEADMTSILKRGRRSNSVNKSKTKKKGSRKGPPRPQ